MNDGNNKAGFRTVSTWTIHHSLSNDKQVLLCVVHGYTKLDTWPLSTSNLIIWKVFVDIIPNKSQHSSKHSKCHPTPSHISLDPSRRLCDISPPLTGSWDSATKSIPQFIFIVKIRESHYNPYPMHALTISQFIDANSLLRQYVCCKLLFFRARLSARCHEGAGLACM